MRREQGGTTEVPVRVGYILTHYPRLAQTFITSEIDGVEGAGLDVRVFAMNPPVQSELRQAGAPERATHTIYLKPRLHHGIALLGAEAFRHPIALARLLRVVLNSGGGSPRRTLRRVAHLLQAAIVAKEARRSGLHYLHAQFGLAPATIAWFASLLTGLSARRIPFGFTIHGFHDFVDRAESRLDLKAQDAAQVLCVSDFTRSQLCLFTGKELWERFFVARCGIDLNAFQFRTPMNRQGSLTILAVGRLSPEKGFDALVAALAELKKRGHPHRLVIIGDGPLRASLEEAAVAADVGGLVEFAGEMPPSRVREYLEAADIFCLPSFSEGLPISIMEAMAVGVPVVTTWIAGIPELASHDVTALTVPPARPDSIASAIRRLAEDPGLRVRLARNARRRVEEQHDMWRCAADIAKRFRAVAIR